MRVTTMVVAYLLLGQLANRFAQLVFRLVQLSGQVLKLSFALVQLTSQIFLQNDQQFRTLLKLSTANRQFLHIATQRFILSSPLLQASGQLLNFLPLFLPSGHLSFHVDGQLIVGLLRHLQLTSQTLVLLSQLPDLQLGIAGAVILLKRFGPGRR